MSTTLYPSQCLFCARFRSPLDGAPERSCGAFGDGGIPGDVWANRVDHRQPVSGDNGLTWTPDEGVDGFPEWVLSAPGTDAQVSMSDGQRNWPATREDLADLLTQVRAHQRTAEPTD